MEAFRNCELHSSNWWVGEGIEIQRACRPGSTCRNASTRFDILSASSLAIGWWDFYADDGPARQRTVRGAVDDDDEGPIPLQWSMSPTELPSGILRCQSGIFLPSKVQSGIKVQKLRCQSISGISGIFCKVSSFSQKFWHFTLLKTDFLWNIFKIWQNFCAFGAFCSMSIRKCSSPHHTSILLFEIKIHYLPFEVKSCVKVQFSNKIIPC